MPYATITDLQDRIGEARLIQLSDLSDPPLGLIDTAVVQRALDDADAEIDGYLVGRYMLPMASPPAILRVIACTIAHGKLLGSAVDESVAGAYKSAQSYLQQVAQGKVSITSPADAQAPVGAGAVLFNPGQKVMGREAEAGD